MGNKFKKANQLSKTELDFLMHNTPFDEQEIKEWYRGFKVTFTNNSNNISLTRLQFS